MSAKDNFAQAFKELISGPGGSADEAVNLEPNEAREPDYASKPLAEQEAPSVAAKMPQAPQQAPAATPVAATPAPVQETAAKPRGFAGFGGFGGFGSSAASSAAAQQPAVPVSNIGFGGGGFSDSFGGYTGQSAATTIASGTVVIGEIHSKGDINLFGEIKGNVETIGNVQLGGRVMGNIAGNDMVLSGSAVKGNIAADGSISVDENSVIMGDMKAQDGDFNGKIKGNLSVTGLAHFQGNTVLLGNVSVGSLIIEQGARLRGEICTGSRDGFDIEDPFQG